MPNPFMGVKLAAAAAGLIGADFGREPGYTIGHRGRRLAKPANPVKKAKRKAQRRARRISRQHG